MQVLGFEVIFNNEPADREKAIERGKHELAEHGYGYDESLTWDATLEDTDNDITYWLVTLST